MLLRAGSAPAVTPLLLCIRTVAAEAERREETAGGRVCPGWRPSPRVVADPLLLCFISSLSSLFPSQGQLSTAVGQLFQVGTKLGSIAGYTSRVSELLEQVRHLNEAGNAPFEVKAEPPHAKLIEPAARAEANPVLVGQADAAFVQEWRGRCDQQQQLRFEVRHSKAGGASADSAARRTGVVGGGTYELADHISFQHVDIVSPEGKLLVRDLNFTVEAGVNVMVTGPNGVGQSRRTPANGR